MIEVGVDGGRKLQRDIATECVFWCVDKLLPKVKKLDIDVEFKDLKGYLGQCFSSSKHEYIIELDKNISFYDMVGTICHEMVHVKQFYKKKLKTDTKNWYWRDSKNVAYRIICDEKTSYHKLPWEKEAFKLDEKLASKFIKQMRTKV